MEFEKILAKGKTIASVNSYELMVADGQSALDLIATMRYETDCDCMVIPSSYFPAEFFILSTGLAGEILQKFVNYGMKLAIVGDFSGYTSKPLKGLIYECNRGNSVFFTGTVEEAVIKLSESGG